MDKTFLEFFAGVGLVRIGLEKEGWKCLFANDNSPKKTKIYRENFGLKQLEEGDIKTIELEKIPHALLATASFPCQDLSEAGPYNGIHGPRSGVFWHFINVLKNLKQSRPPIVLLENVRGFLTAKKGANLILAVSALNNLGYLCDALLIDAKYFVSQSRPRIFVIGVLESQINQANVANIQPTRKSHLFRPEQILRLMRENPGLKWFNFDLPRVRKRYKTLEGLLDSTNKIPQECWFDEEKIERHVKMMPTDHRAEIERLRLQRKKTVFTMYRRMRKGEQKAELRFDGIAGCLRSARGGSSKQFLGTLENGELRMRKFTVRELRRLMKVPWNYSLPDNYNEVYSALGEAVVVPVIEWIARNILNPTCHSLSKKLFETEKPIYLFSQYTEVRQST